LDPFGGGGSTYEAAQRLDRYWLGSEVGDVGPIVERFERNFPDLLSNTPERIAAAFKATPLDGALPVL